MVNIFILSFLRFPGFPLFLVDNESLHRKNLKNPLISSGNPDGKYQLLLLSIIKKSKTIVY
jgi:hypothetical protein